MQSPAAVDDDRNLRAELKAAQEKLEECKKDFEVEVSTVDVPDPITAESLGIKELIEASEKPTVITKDTFNN